ncbi:helix-turn-helix transcriptional regulator [Planotetraspora sp. A-T 1434]|uniref:winged helix-turn-helix transcriptional regulator n=1 Tax=Planotetraspora sp. A-T 1434 TaxID=2979219 RepID=UPI0021BE653D|nr:helix-turn-helix domain-containing protein [Planotetraspora sp. A-T 1434]MCT9930739.1 helix-turn-helix transcriptional regulator [Planotetraspora sp. A-T 1434]
MDTAGEPRGGIGQALLALGDQWSLLILQRAFLKHTRRFAEWRDELAMSDSVLAGRLRELVAGGLLEPSPYRGEGRTRSEYLLTDRARELWTFLVAIWSWERTWVERPGGLPDLVHERCGARTDAELGCAACGKTPVTARDTRTERGAANTFSDVAVHRLHRRTVRERAPRDPLSYFPETLEILGDRWSTVILAAAFLRVRRFAAFQSELGVAPSILSNRLRRFSELGIFVQSDIAGKGHEYRLTDKGLAFFPVFAFLVDWAQRWHSGPPQSEITIVHTACGKPMIPFLRCLNCHEPLVRDEIHFDLTGTVRPGAATG